MSQNSRKRAYQDGCAVAHALDIIGDRWAMPIMRELMLGPKRFTDLRAGLPGISANMLTQRLEELEAASILVRRRLNPSRLCSCRRLLFGAAGLLVYNRC